MKIGSKVFSSNDIDGDASSFLNLDASLSVAVVIVSVNLIFNSWDKFLQDGYHAVEVIEFILSNLLLFKVDSVNVFVNFSINSIFLGFSDRNFCSKSFHFYFKGGVFSPQDIGLVSELSDFFLQLRNFRSCFSDPLVVLSNFGLASLNTCLESFLPVFGGS